MKDNMKITSESKITAIVSQMTEEELKDYYKICTNIDIFAREMKIRFAEKSMYGRKGWDNNNFDIPKEISDRAERLSNGDSNVDIGIANWGFINWFNRE